MKYQAERYTKDLVDNIRPYLKKYMLQMQQYVDIDNINIDLDSPSGFTLAVAGTDVWTKDKVLVTAVTEPTKLAIKKVDEVARSIGEVTIDLKSPWDNFVYDSSLTSKDK